MTYQRFTEEQVDSMADELIWRIFGTKTPSASRIEVFLNILLENEDEMKNFIKQAAEIVEWHWELIC